MSTLTRDRVLGDVDVLSRAGLDLDDFLAEAVASVRRAVPWVAACVGTHDPATRILTSARKYGDLAGRNEQDVLFGVIEYDSADPTSYRTLEEQGVDVVSMQRHTDGEVERSERMGRLMVPEFGYHDEARLLFRDGGSFWGGMAIFRGADDDPFSADDLDFLAGLSGGFARGVRGGVLARVAQTSLVPAAGPAVVIVGADDQILQASPSATARLDELRGRANGGDPFGVLAGLVASARRQARGDSTAAPRARVRTPGGQWLLLHASPLAGAAEDRVGEVVVTIEEARPPEIVSLVVAAFGLTPRERDVTALVLQGVDTKEIASTLHVSAYTVQDHLKSVFDKADVRSRRELIARIYFDQYVPRMGADLGPNGWFAG